ncbi:hypothetical protein ACFO0A_05435 [Novosphingobium tardum]|jgi:hypothetical protein|uniref:Uncharacterized protein n=1 Tax=Novosphingobium tardum TaxID=1538021 RepID=A0ABV8RNT9_9SPHN
MGLEDTEYFKRRLEEELAEAARADRLDVQRVHEKMADLYRARIRQAGNGAEDSTLKLEVHAVRAIIDRD